MKALENRESLVVGKEYLLRTYLEGGDVADESEWISVVWNGKSLVDSEGMTWTEWLEPDTSDVFEKS